MVPKGDDDFEPQTLPVDSLRKYGFESPAEFNSFRYTDYCFKKFIEAAKKETYFSNTVFVFIGDHGVAGNANEMYSKAWTTERLTDEHVPLLFYAPYLLMPQRRIETVSQIDVLPTIAGMVQQPYVNTTLGRDLLQPTKQNNYAFIIYHDEGKIGVVTDSYYFTKNLNFQREEIHFLDPTSRHSLHEIDSLRKKMSVVTSGFYETAKWMLVHNKK